MPRASFQFDSLSFRFNENIKKTREGKEVTKVLSLFLKIDTARVE
jgi:hypothetical protein